MTYRDVYIAERLMQARLEERRQRAEARRLVQELRRDNPGWLVRQGGLLLYRLGRGLLALGQDLQQAGPPRTTPISGDAVSRG